MSVLSFQAGQTGLVGIAPRVFYITTSASLATLTTAGWLNPTLLNEGTGITAIDILYIVYAATGTPLAGTFGIFTPTIANGVVTLASWVDAGNVLLPVVNGDVASFSGTTGLITDSGILATNIVSKAAVNIMAAGSQIITDKATGVTTAGAITMNKMSGVLTTPALTTASGAAYSITLTNSEIATTSVLLCQVQGGTNTTAGITIIATPGAGSATILLENSGVAAAALSGTVILSFLVH